MKKKIYNQPLVETMAVVHGSIICDGSSPDPDLHFGGGGNPGGAGAPKRGTPIFAN
jgi:hypothetical protein